MGTPDVSDLTSRFRTLDEKDAQGSAEAARAKGSVLAEGAERLGRGADGEWVRLPPLCPPIPSRDSLSKLVLRFCSAF
jgi:hypothetical protein